MVFAVRAAAAPVKQYVARRRGWGAAGVASALAVSSADRKMFCRRFSRAWARRRVRAWGAARHQPRSATHTQRCSHALKKHASSYTSDVMITYDIETNLYILSSDATGAPTLQLHQGCAWKSFRLRWKVHHSQVPSHILWLLVIVSVLAFPAALHPRNTGEYGLSCGGGGHSRCLAAVGNKSKC